MLKNKRNGLLLACCLVSLLGFGCNQKPKEDHNSQVLTKVNDEEISVHQLNYALSHANSKSLPADADVAKKQILVSLVDLSVVYQQALAEKLDRDPDVMMALEESKRQVLAQSWLKKLSDSLPKPAQSEIEAYYKTHPDLFEQHKVFKLQEVLISSADYTLATYTLINNNSQLDEILKALAAQNISIQSRHVAQGAEGISTDQLSRLSALKEGEFITMNQPNGSLVLVGLQSVEINHIDTEKAYPLIEKYLANKATMEKIQSSQKDLVSKAKIEFQGEFSSLNALFKPNTAPTQSTSNAGGESGKTFDFSASPKVENEPNL